MFFAVTEARCSEQSVFDGSSEAAATQSQKRMIEGLSKADAEAFVRGVAAIKLEYARRTAAKAEGGLIGRLSMMADALKISYVGLDGMTRNQIIARGRQLNGGPAGETTKVSSNPEVLKCLRSAVRLTSSRLSEAKYGRSQLWFVVNNRLSWAISVVAVKYVVRNPSRAVPYAKDDFAVSISGGIEPGETKLVGVDLFSYKGPYHNITVDLVLLDVADPEGRFLIRQRTFDSPSDTSPLGCVLAKS